MQLGLTSVTMPTLTVEAILQMAKANSLEVIEWSEQHVKHGDIKKAEAVGEQTKAAGLKVVAYHAAFDIQQATESEFSKVLETAVGLGTDTVILSAGAKSAEHLSDEKLMCLAEKVQHFVDVAADKKMTLCFIYSRDTLLDDYVFANRFLDALGRENVRLSWQPSRTSSLIYNIFDLKMLAPFVHHVYISYVEASEGCTTMLECKDEWQQYLKVLKGQTSNIFLFKDCDIEAFDTECNLMKDWIAGIYTE